jgi:formamidopyrimidine-DNA glycosylase
MPELPEVETLCRQLNQVLPGRQILRVDRFDPRLGTLTGLAGQKVTEVRRRGKYIEIRLKSGITAELHLRMSGRLLFLPWEEGAEPAAGPLPPPGPGAPDPGREAAGGGVDRFPYCRLALSFSSGALLLIDPRRFATFLLRSGEQTAACPDPLEGLSAAFLGQVARRRRLPVKSLLMDQRLIGGIGNIYACEILFDARIDPRRPSCSLTAAEWRRIAKAAPAILSRAVACRGTTVSDWRDLFGASGTNQNHLDVYSRQGEPCSRCGTPIARIVQSGRGTWYCPACQR